MCTAHQRDTASKNDHQDEVLKGLVFCNPGHPPTYFPPLLALWRVIPARPAAATPVKQCDFAVIIIIPSICHWYFDRGRTGAWMESKANISWVLYSSIEVMFDRFLCVLVQATEATRKNRPMAAVPQMDGDGLYSESDWWWWPVSR